MNNTLRQNPKQGNAFSRMTNFSKILSVALVLGIVGTVVWFYAPGLRVSASQTLTELTLDDTKLDNQSDTNLVVLPTTRPSNKVQSTPQVTIGTYAWNGLTPLVAATGGPFTTKGSLMEQNGVNLRIVRQDWLSGLREMQMKFIEQYDSGQEFPDSDRSAMGITIMGDGAPFYISTMQGALDAKFGKGKYHVEVVGAFGMSDGEDKVIGPQEWKTNPKSMIGALISTVPGDGDWVTLLNYCFANGLKVNPNFNTYDADAVNIFPSKDDDYINSAKELIASQTEGFTVTLKVVKDGQLTGETIEKEIDGCATWTPGDKMVFDALVGYTDIASTRDFPNQMATTLIVVKEWAATHPEIVSNILKSALTASNQIKQYDEWAVRGSEAIEATFKVETPQYWYDMFKGQTGTKNGITYNMGGTRVLNYADVMQYYGITDGTNRYKAVYNQVSGYLVNLNPFGFNESVDGIVPYADAVNLFYLKNINDIDAGTTSEVDYTTTKTEVLADGDWYINFNTGSAEILNTSNTDLASIYNLLIQAEQTKVLVSGHTDNTGSASINFPLSEDRANSVVNYLVKRGISRDRIQEVSGKGDSEPIAPNNTNRGRATNRRVQVTFVQ
tara:strand:+ start:164433 stop:166271 length:1839 start_codon:yes stop_codon:yes gene_type:complete